MSAFVYFSCLIALARLPMNCSIEVVRIKFLVLFSALGSNLLIFNFSAVSMML